MGSTGQVIAAGRQVYRLRTGQKVTYAAAALMSAGMTALFFIQSADDVQPSLGMLLAAVFAASSGYMALFGLRSRLVVEGNRVQVHGAFRTREFNLSEVEGSRTINSRYESRKVLCLRDKHWRIALTRYAIDTPLNDWFNELEDLDRRDRNQLLRNIERDENLGVTPEQRRGALKRAKVLNISACVVNGISAAVVGFGLERYRSIAVLVLAAAPIVAGYALYRQPLFFGFFNQKQDPRAEVSPLLMISGFGLLIGSADVNFISVGMLTAFIGGGFFACLAIYYPVARKSSQFGGALFGLCIMSAFYGWGLATSVDVTADRSVPRVYTAQVLGGQVSHGSRSTSYYLDLEPWGPYENADGQMKVSEKMYSATQRGQIICLALHQGALHAPWYEPVSCGDKSQSTGMP